MIEYLREKLLEKVQKEVDSLGDGGLKGKISDGYHTFDELYEHRIALWITVCRLREEYDFINSIPSSVWKSKKHSDGSSWDGWFLLGIHEKEGSQMTYHLPEKYWKDCHFARTLRNAPQFDGHTPSDVLKRLITI